MSTLIVHTPFNIDVEFPLAPFAKRAAATIIDLVIVTIYAYVVMFLLSSFTDIASDEWMETAIIAVVSIPCFLYLLLTELFMNGQTPGKRLVGIKVMDRMGDEPTMSQYLIRWILGIGTYLFLSIPYLVYTLHASVAIGILRLGFMLIVYLPAVICVAVTKKSQRAGDLAAGTVVIDQRSRTGLQDTIYLEIEDDNYEVKYPQVMRLSDRDINGIRNLLAMKTNSRDIDTYTIDVAHRIKQVLSVESDLMPREFLHQLLQDYNYLTSR